MNQEHNAAIAVEPPPVRTVPPAAIGRWLQLGWRDFRRAGWPSLLHGLIVVLASLVIVDIALLFWPLLPGAVSGFLVVGPILATGLYALSQALEQGRPARLREALDAWRHGSRCLWRFGALLAAVATLWVLLSVLLFHFFVQVHIETPADFLRYVVVQADESFLLWSVLAGIFAALCFALSVVAVPLLVDRDVTTPVALVASLRTVGENPGTMLWWALFLLVATGVALATLMLGFLVLYPLMGHASWHAYRDLVDVTGLPPRPSG
jgi:uncharacterized membrane protein